MKYKYDVEITTSTKVPPGVIEDHLAYSLETIAPGKNEVTARASGGIFEENELRNHPFEGPEVFDDVKYLNPGEKTGGLPKIPETRDPFYDQMRQEWPAIHRVISILRYGRDTEEVPVKPQ